jgi:glutathione S-transferase
VASARYAKSREALVQLTEETYPAVLGRLEGRLGERGGQHLVGSAFTWADLHLFFFCSEDFLEPGVLAGYPGLAGLAGRVGALPAIKGWVEGRPADGKMPDGYKIYFQNAYKILQGMD